MKNKKWLWVTLTVLLTLIVLTGVASAGFRMGVMQSANLVKNADGTTSSLSPFGHMHGFESNFNNQREGDPHTMQGFGHGGRGGSEHGRGGFPPIFGLIHLAILGLILWFGFKLIKNSGWRLTRVTQPVESEIPNTVVDEKKD